MTPDHEHIDDILRQWPYDPERLNVRLAQGEDGREILQMRVDLGLLQLETSGRPDGERPQGAETYYDYLVRQTSFRGADFVLGEDECAEVDREFVQYYHRRICWLRLQNYRRAVEDADHTLGLMDLCHKHSADELWTMSHEQYRPYVLFHRTQAAALAVLDDGGPEDAVQEVNRGLEQLRLLFAEHGVAEHFEDDELVAKLIEFRESLRQQYDVGRTLQERLDDAVEAEQYELAARLRDELARRTSPP